MGTGQEAPGVGLVTKAIDPLGRETVYVYGTDSTPDANPPPKPHRG